MITFTPHNKLRKVKIEVKSGQEIELEIPDDTTWVMIERSSVYISSDKKQPKLEKGFYDGHGNDWVNYPFYDAFNKSYLGSLSESCSTRLVEVANLK